MSDENQAIEYNLVDQIHNDSIIVDLFYVSIISKYIFN
jgi:hypothetical protein